MLHLINTYISINESVTLRMKSVLFKILSVWMHRQGKAIEFHVKCFGDSTAAVETDRGTAWTASRVCSVWWCRTCHPEQDDILSAHPDGKWEVNVRRIMEIIILSLIIGNCRTNQWPRSSLRGFGCKIWGLLARGRAVRRTIVGAQTNYHELNNCQGLLSCPEMSSNPNEEVVWFGEHLATDKLYSIYWVRLYSQQAIQSASPMALLYAAIAKWG